MLTQLQTKSAECPQTKFALGGHSQKGFVTVDVIPQIPVNLPSKVVAVTMFGARPCPKLVSDRCVSYCAAGDSVSVALLRPSLQNNNYFRHVVVEVVEEEPQQVKAGKEDQSTLR